MITRKIEFMNRLFKLSYCQEELLQFLIDEKLITDFERSCVKDTADLPKFYVTLLERLCKEEKLMLADYEWIMLPVERLKLTLVTERNTRELLYNF